MPCGVIKRQSSCHQGERVRREPEEVLMTCMQKVIGLGLDIRALACPSAGACVVLVKWTTDATLTHQTTKLSNKRLDKLLG